MRLQYLLLVLALIVCQFVVYGQDAGATVISGDEAAATVDALGDKGDDTTTSTDDKPRIPTEDAILGQLPPIPPLRSGIPSLDAFYLLFPALGSLLRWGSLFPAHSILGAVPDSLPSQIQPQPQAAASKVVLVLADDAQAKSRVARQDAGGASPLNGPAMFTSLLGQMAPPNLGQMMNPDTLGQLVPQVGQALQQFQMPQLPQMPFQGLDGILGAPLPMLGAPAPTPTTAPPATPKSASDDPPPPAPSATPAGSFGGFFNPSNFDTTNLLGQMQAQLPPLPSMPAGTPDIMAGLRQFWPGAAGPGSSAQASDISEVRVKPGDQMAQLKIKSPQAFEQDKDQENIPLLWFRMPMTDDDDTDKETSKKQSEDLRIKSKLQAFERQVISELKLLQQIERVAKEMRMQANTQGTTSTSSFSPYKINYPLSRTPVHKITRADIERALRDDYVRRLLHKEAQRKTWANQKSKYVRDEAVDKDTGAAFKRQANLSKDDIVKMMAYAYRMASEQQQQEEEKIKEDKMYAAFRASSRQSAQEQNPMMMQQRQMAEEQARQQAQQNPMMMQQRQMAEDQARAQQMQQLQMQQRQMMEEQSRQQAQQNPMMMQQRQMMEEQARQQAQENPMMMQQRQMMEEQARQQAQQNPMMMQQRQMAEDQARAQQMQQIQMQQRQMSEEQARQQAQQNPMMMQQRQMAEEQARQQAQQNPMMMQQRQMAEEQTRVQQMQQLQMQQRQMAEEQARQQAQQNPMMMQQRQMAEEQARQQAQQNPMMMQQRQMADEQARAQQMQQLQMQQRQMMEEQARQQIQQNPMMMQQRQMMEEQARQEQALQNPMMPQQRQMTDDQTNTMTLDEQKWTDDKIRAMQQINMAEDKPEETMVGAAEPQMPENAGQARHKGNLYGIFPSRDSNRSHSVDLLGLGGNKRKKSKSNIATPTIINYYQSAPAVRPSYGTSYGYGGQGSNAYGSGQSVGYRAAALGNDEIDEMLRQHQTMATINHPDDQKKKVNQEIASKMTPTTLPLTSSLSPPAAAAPHHLQKRLANFYKNFRPAIDPRSTDKGNENHKGCGCGSSHCRCGKGCRCGNGNGCQCAFRGQRQRRSTEYGTLETIDESSLNALRKEYRLGLKEITLSPDEDPAEALMRYNAASIREALERASLEPFEISGDQMAEGVQEQEQDYQQDMEPLETATSTITSTSTTTTTPTIPAIISTTETPEVTTAKIDISSTSTSTEPSIETTSTSTTTTTTSTSTTTPIATTTPITSSGDHSDQKEVAKGNATLMESHKEELKVLHKIIDELKEEFASLSKKCQGPLKNKKTEATSSSGPCQAQIMAKHINAIDKGGKIDAKNWQQLLASRGYDTKYLTKTNEQQYKHGENLELPKPISESNLSSEYSYQEFPTQFGDDIDPDADENKSKRATNSTRSLGVKERAQLLNVELNNNQNEMEQSTLSPYALRGKFISPKHRRSNQRTTRQAQIMPPNSSRKYPTSMPISQLNSKKIDQLIDVVNELLQLQLKKERATISAGCPTVVSNNVSKSNGKRVVIPVKRRRLRRRQRKQLSTTRRPFKS